MVVSIAILKVLSSYPEGRASHAALKADLAILSSREWFGRMRALAAIAGPINIFRDSLVTRDAHGWGITQAGRDILARVESEGESDVAGPRRSKLQIVASSESPAALRASLQSPPLQLMRSA